MLSSTGFTARSLILLLSLAGIAAAGQTDRQQVTLLRPSREALEGRRAGGFRPDLNTSQRLANWWTHERGRWSLHFYGGQNVTDTLFELFGGEVHGHSTGMVSAGAVRDSGAFLGVYEDQWWWPSWELEYCFTRRLERKSFNEHNLVPLRLRWDLPLGDFVERHLEFSFAVSEGVSLAGRVPDVEVRRNEKSHQLQNFLALDFIFGLPRLARFAPRAGGMSMFFRIHHRSDFYGLYPEDGGSNTLTLGVSFGGSRTQKRGDW